MNRHLVLGLIDPVDDAVRPATVEDGRLILIPASVIPDDQAWFWTPEWQAKEAEADQEIANGGACPPSSGWRAS
jgi:hypothetical protein